MENDACFLAEIILPPWFSLSGCFRKWWYPQIIHFNRGFHYKPSILGETPLFLETPILFTVGFFFPVPGTQGFLQLSQIWQGRQPLWRRQRGTNLPSPFRLVWSQKVVLPKKPIEIRCLFPQIAIAIGVLTSNRGGGRRTTLADWTWQQGAIAGCSGRGAIPRDHCKVLL